MVFRGLYSAAAIALLKSSITAWLLKEADILRVTIPVLQISIGNICQPFNFARMLCFLPKSFTPHLLIIGLLHMNIHS
jgi:hypothetical protein